MTVSGIAGGMVGGAVGGVVGSVVSSTVGSLAGSAVGVMVSAGIISITATLNNFMEGEDVAPGLLASGLLAAPAGLLLVYYPTVFLLNRGNWATVVFFWLAWLTGYAGFLIQGARRQREAKNPLRGLLEVSRQAALGPGTGSQK